MDRDTMMSVLPPAAILPPIAGQSWPLDELVAPIVQIIVGIVVAVVGGIYVWKYKEARNREKEKADRLKKIENTIFGIDDVETMEGIVEVMGSNYKQTEENERRIDDLDKELEELKERQERISRRVENLRRRAEVRERRRGADYTNNDRDEEDTND